MAGITQPPPSHGVMFRHHGGRGLVSLSSATFYNGMCMSLKSRWLTFISTVYIYNTTNPMLSMVRLIILKGLGKKHD